MPSTVTGMERESRVKSFLSFSGDVLPKHVGTAFTAHKTQALLILVLPQAEASGHWKPFPGERTFSPDRMNLNCPVCLTLTLTLPTGNLKDQLEPTHHK